MSEDYTMRRLVIFFLCFCFAGLSYAQDNQDPYATALEAIENARVNGASQLDLQSLGLTELPPEIGQLSRVEIIWLGFNDLSELPPEIGNLRNLKTLILTQNQLSTLPPEFGNLSNLEGLWIGENQLSTLPP